MNEKEYEVMSNELDGQRLQRYAMYAAIPAIGTGAALHAGDTSDFLHYGGPAIVFERDMDYPAGSGSYGRGPIATAPFEALNINVTLPGSKSGPSKQASGAVIRTTSGSSKKDTGIRMGNRAASEGPPWGAMLSLDETVGGGSTTFNYRSAFLAFRQTGTFKSQDLTFSVGDWLTSDGDEVRGYLGFNRAGEGLGTGWLDIGWDGDVLTIYDYAVNFVGGIKAGQTEAASAVPGAGGLAVLAMGASGLRRRRKRSA